MASWVLSPRATAELEDILQFIAEASGSQVTAQRMLDAFTRALDQLAVTPRMGRRRPHLTGHAVRWWPVHRYLIAYDPESQPLRVIRVLHGSRDLDQIFGQDHGNA